jgi:hypothetical protein
VLLPRGPLPHANLQHDTDRGVLVLDAAERGGEDAQDVQRDRVSSLGRASETMETKTARSSASNMHNGLMLGSRHVFLSFMWWAPIAIERNKKMD